MDLRVLRYFLTVAREGNISSAASRLGVTQPTLSRQLQELESEFHIKLFNRGCRGRTLTLTEKGAILRHRAEEILLLSEKTACELKSEECISGNVYIGVSAGAGAALEAVGRAAAQIKAEHVHTEIVIRKNGCCALYDAVDKGTCDFVLVPEFIDMWDLQCESVPGTKSLVEPGFYVTTASPLAAGKHCSAEELSDFYILNGEDEREFQFFKDFLCSASSAVNNAGTYVELDHALSLLRGAGEKYAVAGFKAQIPADLRVISPVGTPAWSVKLCRRASSVLSPQARIFAEILLNKKLTH